MTDASISRPSIQSSVHIVKHSHPNIFRLNLTPCQPPVSILPSTTDCFMASLSASLSLWTGEVIGNVDLRVSASCLQSNEHPSILLIGIIDVFNGKPSDVLPLGSYHIIPCCDLRVYAVVTWNAFTSCPCLKTMIQPSVLGKAAMRCMANWSKVSHVHTVVNKYP
jgi:hypothetical protein